MQVTPPEPSLRQDDLRVDPGHLDSKEGRDDMCFLLNAEEKFNNKCHPGESRDPLAMHLAATVDGRTFNAPHRDKSSNP